MSEWISVKDRLPEKDGKYVVWSDGELNICEYDVESQTFGDTYEDYDDMYSPLVCWDDCINESVTHWQPLPEPSESAEITGGKIVMDEYISREEVVKEIKSRIFDADDAWESGYNTAMAGIMEWIEHMPSADVQPVKHGRWTWDSNAPHRDYGAYKCNNCGYHSDFEENYCPNCGARMDGDSE